jgi:probable HAF family extracellular repeat protein
MPLPRLRLQQIFGGSFMYFCTRLATAAVLATCTALAMAATPPPQYTLTLLGNYGATGSLATGISENGSIVGYSFNVVDTASGQFFVNQVPFVYTQGVGTALPVPAGMSAADARGVNDSGTVAGRTYNTADTGTGPLPVATSFRAISTQGGVVTELGGVRSSAAAINNAGVVVGRSRFGNSNRATMFAGGQVIDLGSLPGSLSSSASAVNDSGDAAGFSFDAVGQQVATLFSQGQVINLGVAAGRSSTALGMNNSRQVVGWMESADGLSTTAYLYSNGVVTDLGTLGGLTFSQAMDVNNAGWVVGMAIYEDRPENIPFLRIDGELVDLNTLVTADSLGTWLVSDVSAINDQGQIVGAVIRDGVRMAALLTPVPEMPSFVLLALGLAALGGLRSRRVQLLCRTTTA